MVVGGSMAVRLTGWSVVAYKLDDCGWCHVSGTYWAGSDGI